LFNISGHQKTISIHNFPKAFYVDLKALRFLLIRNTILSYISL